MSETIRISPADLGAVKRAADLANSAGDRIGRATDRAARVAGQVEQAIGNLLGHREQLERFLGVEQGSQEAEDLRQELEAFQGGLSGFERGAALGAATGIPGAGATVGATLAGVGAGLGRAQRERRREIFRAEAARATAEAEFRARLAEQRATAASEQTAHERTEATRYASRRWRRGS